MQSWSGAHRVDYIREPVLKHITSGVTLVETRGGRVGQINDLSVYRLIIWYLANRPALLQPPASAVVNSSISSVNPGLLETSTPRR